MNRTLPLILAAAAALAVPTLASAQDGTSPPQRIRSVTLQPGQKCPPSTGDEVVVCGTVSEPYRIPRALRDSGPIAAQNQSWVNRAAQLDQIGRVAGGLPNTCSPIGTGGATGCSLQAAPGLCAGPARRRRRRGAGSLRSLARRRYASGGRDLSAPCMTSSR